MKKVHLGCGNYILPDWVNVDIVDHPKILKHDISTGLPFEDNSVDFFFSEHFLEHLSKEHGIKLIKEIHRCLKSKGVSRTVVPDLDYLVKAYNENNLAAYSAISWKTDSRGDMLNYGMTNWSHRYMYNIEELALIHKLSNFKTFYFTEHKKSKYTELNGIGHRVYSGELSFESIKD